MKLRHGRRKGETAYLQLGPEPSDADEILFTVRGGAAHVAWLVAAVAYAESWASETEPVGLHNDVEYEAYRAAREAIR